MDSLDFNLLLENATPAQNRVLSTVNCRVSGAPMVDEGYTRLATLYADGSIVEGNLLDVYTPESVMRINAIPILLPDKTDKDRLLDLLLLGNDRSQGELYVELCTLVKKLFLEKE
jgi:hypothetical protein